MPFISQILRAKQGREYQLQAKIGQNYYGISNCMVSSRQNKRGQNNIFACEVANFLSSQIKGFYSTSEIIASDKACIYLTPSFGVNPKLWTMNFGLKK